MHMFKLKVLVCVGVQLMYPFTRGGISGCYGPVVLLVVPTAGLASGGSTQKT